MTATAKLFKHGRSQAVRLPKEFRMPGTEVKVSREGNRVVLEPVVFSQSREDLAAFWANIDRLRTEDFFPNGREQPDMPESNVDFDA
jgi:antitoxin VapB